MVDFEDFKRADGSTDWAAYDAAQIAAGELCQECRGPICGASAGPRTCIDCEYLRRSPAAESHPRLTRCPFCRHVQGTDRGWEEGTARIDCEQCERTYEIGVRVHLTFRSPAVATESLAAASDA